MNKLANGLVDRLPEELKWNRQWCIAGTDKAPYSVGKRGNLFRASNTNPKEWLDFETALEFANHYNLQIGYILSETDKFSCIDLDVCDEASQIRKGHPVDPSKWSAQADFDRFWLIVQHFNSYTERSTHGKGLHIWVRGKIGKGANGRDGVEVYSQERFIICTGDAIVNTAIEDRQELLDILITEIRANQGYKKLSKLVEIEETEADAVIWQRAAEANNSSKFVDLCEGKWAGNYKSQSEADLALMSIFTFYSKSNAQCRRMFRNTKLGIREKAVMDDRYLDETLLLIRGRQEDEDAAVAHGRSIAENLLAQMRAPQQVSHLVQELQAHAIQQKQIMMAIPQPAPAVVEMAQLAPLPKVKEGSLPWPPGFVGALAGFIYQSAPRPVKEVAIVAALGLMAGICGKSYAVPQSGLNLYIILVARSAVGKEAMHSGISLLMESLRSRIPQAMSFVDFNEMASGPALTKAVAANQSFLNVNGEWGKHLEALANETRAGGPMASLRKVMTNLYQKSGPSAIVGGISYSNKDENVSSVSGVAYSMIGETTPDTLYEALTPSMMKDGFLSRFTMIAYEGKRVPHNHNALKFPDAALSDALAQLCAQSLAILNRQARQDVGRNPGAAQLLEDFDKEYDDKINATDDESYRQMFNRAQLKILRIAALLAVGDNFLHPVIQEHHVLWAKDVVERDIEIMDRKIKEGDVGISDNARERKILALCKNFLLNGAASSYGIPQLMQTEGVITRKYFQIRIAQQTSFYNHKLGANAALDITIRSLVDSGYLMEVDKAELSKRYGYHGKAYRIIDLMRE